MSTEKPASEAKAVKAAFGAQNRKRLIDAYFNEAGIPAVQTEAAWRHVYELLLWIDQTTGLAHCYESDKSQPGKNWYARSLAFHEWLAASFGTPPAEVAGTLDWLFLRATKDLAAEVVHKAERVAANAARQRAPYKGRGFPKPGEDPELVSIVKEVLGGNLGPEPTDQQWQLLVQRIRQYLALENKRKNLLGEGFEDVLAQIASRSSGGVPLEVHTRKPLQDLPGFANAKRGEKPNKVDVAILRPGRRTLITVKWSLRADRERQFISDYNDYVHAESDSKPFDYDFVTNEFDPARLKRACEQLAGNKPMFDHVVHINTDALKAAYGNASEPTMGQVLAHIENGRLISLERWLQRLKS